MPHQPGHEQEVVDTSTFTEEQQILFDEAAALAPEATQVTSTGAINAEVLNDQTPLQTIQAEAPPITGENVPIPEPSPAPEPVAEDTSFAGTTNQLVQDLLADSGLGAEIAQTTTELTEESGLTGLQKTSEDLFRRAQSLQLKSQDLGLQVGEAAQRIVQESEGRGRTLRAIGGLTESAQRKVNLKRAEVRGDLLETVATLNAVQGRITTARAQIADAIEAKFGVRIAERQAKIDNLNIIQSSGVLTREENKRAEAQKIIQEKERVELEEQKATATAVKNLTLNNASIIANLPNGGEILQQLLGAETEAEWLKIATDSGVFKALPPSVTDKLKEDLLRVQLAKANLDFSQAQKAANNATPPGVLQALSDDQRSAYFKLVDKYEANSKDFFKVRDAFTRITASAEDPSPAGDVAVVFNYMKMLDPGSVVRESEFALAASTGSLNEALKNKFGKIATGEILGFTRDDFVDRATKLFDAALKQQEALNNTFEDRAFKFGIPAGNVTRSIDVLNRPSDVDGLDSSDISEIDEILGVDPNTGLFEETALFNLFPNL